MAGIQQGVKDHACADDAPSSVCGSSCCNSRIPKFCLRTKSEILLGRAASASRNFGAKNEYLRHCPDVQSVAAASNKANVETSNNSLRRSLRMILLGNNNSNSPAREGGPGRVLERKNKVAYARTAFQ